MSTSVIESTTAWYYGAPHLQDDRVRQLPVKFGLKPGANSLPALNRQPLALPGSKRWFPVNSTHTSPATRAGEEGPGLYPGAERGSRKPETAPEDARKGRSLGRLALRGKSVSGRQGRFRATAYLRVPSRELHLEFLLCGSCQGKGIAGSIGWRQGTYEPYGGDALKLGR